MIRLTGLVDLRPVHNTPIGSALREEESVGEDKWIQGAVEKPGALHKQLGVPAEEKIPVEKLQTAAKAGGKLGKRARLALTLRKMKEGQTCSPEEMHELEEELDKVGHEDADINNDGKVDATDTYLKHRRDVVSKNLEEHQDHEVSIATNSLDAIIQDATTLREKLGVDEKDIPAWIQDHITNAANYIHQAAANYHEYNTPNTPSTDEVSPSQDHHRPDLAHEKVNEVAPKGWEGTVKAMKKHHDKIDNPWALAYYMKSKGYKSRKGK